MCIGPVLLVDRLTHGLPVEGAGDVVALRQLGIEQGVIDRHLLDHQPVGAGLRRLGAEARPAHAIGKRHIAPLAEGDGGHAVHVDLILDQHGDAVDGKLGDVVGPERDQNLVGDAQRRKGCKG